MKKLVIGMIVLSSCGTEVIEGVPGPQGPQGPNTPIAEVSVFQQEINKVISEENDYRDNVGQAPLEKGLVCTLYTVPNTTTNIATAVLTTKLSFVYRGVFNQQAGPASDGLNVLPSAIRTLYTSWYVVKCRGQIVSIDSDYYQFDLTSDDGSLLFLDGVKLIDNDGNHGPALVSGSKLLRRGIHSFELAYMQGPAGSQALTLDSKGASVSQALFYR